MNTKLVQRNRPLAVRLTATAPGRLHVRARALVIAPLALTLGLVVASALPAFGAESPSQAQTQVRADYGAIITGLIPKLADSSAGNRYSAQMSLQELAAAASAPGKETDRADLAKILADRASDAAVPQPARVWIVRQLQYMGGAEAVPALTTLLKDADAELRECARRALEQNPSPEANVSLLASVAGAGDAAWKKALVHSMGQRRDVASVSALVPLLRDTALEPTAAEALGNIASAEATAALQASPATPATGAALIAAAERCPPATASAIYRQLIESKQSSSVRAAALRGLARTAPDAFASSVKPYLTGADTQLRAAAIEGCARVPAAGAIAAQALAELPAATRILALNSIEHWEFSPLREQLTEDDAGVRAAACSALARLGSPDATGLLLTLSVNGSPADRALAQSALATVKSPESLATLRKAAGEGDAARRQAAVSALVARRDIESLPMLAQAIASTDPALRRTALNGLRQMGGGAEIAAVARLAASASAPEAREALTAMAGRVTDKLGAAEQLLMMAGGKPDTVAAFAEALAVLGGASALDAVARATVEAKPDARIEAITALGTWPTLAAAQPLQAVISDPAAGPKLHSAAFAALAQLAQGAEKSPLEARGAALLPALAQAKQTADRRVILAALATVPTAEVGEALRPLLTDPSVRNEASVALVAIAEAMRPTQVALAKQFAQAVKASNPSREVLVRAERVLR